MMWTSVMETLSVLFTLDFLLFIFHTPLSLYEHLHKAIFFFWSCQRSPRWMKPSTATTCTYSLTRTSMIQRAASTIRWRSLNCSNSDQMFFWRATGVPNILRVKKDLKLDHVRLMAAPLVCSFPSTAPRKFSPPRIPAPAPPVTAVRRQPLLLPSLTSGGLCQDPERPPEAAPPPSSHRRRRRPPLWLWSCRRYLICPPQVQNIFTKFTVIVLMSSTNIFTRCGKIFACCTWVKIWILA